MDKEFWTVTEVTEIFEVEERFITELEEEEILCPTCGEKPLSKLFPAEELEKLRLAKILSEEMGVNMAGVEVVLRIRQNMFEMRRQFDEILDDLAQRVRETMKEVP